MKKVLVIACDINMSLSDRLLGFANESINTLEVLGVPAMNRAIDTAANNPIVPGLDDPLLLNEYTELSEHTISMLGATGSFLPIFEKMLKGKQFDDYTEEDTTFMIRIAETFRMMSKAMLTAVEEYPGSCSIDTIIDLNSINSAATILGNQLKPLDYKHNAPRFKMEAKMRETLENVKFDPENPPSEEELQSILTNLADMASDIEPAADGEQSPEEWLKGLKESVGARSMKANEEDKLKE